MCKQFDAIFESIKLCSKQQFANNDYFTNLNNIDLSSNMMNDPTFINFIENIFPECISLKYLNISFNQITCKSLKAIYDLANAKVSNRLSSIVNILMFTAHFIQF